MNEQANQPNLDKLTPRNEAMLSKLRNQLSAQERVILADLWESDVRKVLEKLFGHRQLQIAQQNLQSSPDHYHTREMRGRSLELKYISDVMSDNLKRTNKERAEKKSQ